MNEETVFVVNRAQYRECVMQIFVPTRICSNSRCFWKMTRECGRNSPSWFWALRKRNATWFFCAFSRRESAQASSWTDICIRAKINVPEKSAIRLMALHHTEKSVPRADAAIVGNCMLSNTLLTRYQEKPVKFWDRSKNSLFVVLKRYELADGQSLRRIS